MEGNGHAPSDIIVCGRCETACDSSDRFCRQCGLHLHESQVPSLWDDPRSPVPWRPAQTSMVVKGAAVIAAGTIAELLVRRLVRGVLSGGDSKPESTKAITVTPESANSNGHHEAEVVTETLLLRRIRFRR